MSEREWIDGTDPMAMLRGLGTRHGISDRKLRLFGCACCRLNLHLSTDLPASAGLVAAGEKIADGIALTDHDRGAPDRRRVRGNGSIEEACGWVSMRGFSGMMDKLNFVTAQARRKGQFYGEDGKRFADLLREIVGNPWRPVLAESAAAEAIAGRYICEKCGHRDDIPNARQRICTNCLTQYVRKERRGDAPGVVVVRQAWLTPDVRALAEAAYQERGKECPRRKHRPCGNLCRECDGSGRIMADGTLDAVRLCVLADALEEAGCPAEAPCDKCDYDGSTCKKGGLHPLLAHLRSDGPHYRGCFAIDALLGKE